jgi:hypothetical protein
VKGVIANAGSRHHRTYRKGYLEHRDGNEHPHPALITGAVSHETSLPGIGEHTPHYGPS